jgi:hypothetical protein
MDLLPVAFRLVPPTIAAVSSPSAGLTTLAWNSFSGGTYQIEYSTTLGISNWTTLSPNLTATGSVTSFSDNIVSASQRYYRVRLLP